MEHKLVLYPDPVLTKVCEPVKLPLSKEDENLLNEMYNFVKDPKNNAIGLAAPQFGESKRMFVIRLNFADLKLYLKMVNPRLILKQGKAPYFMKNGEACLSEPELTVNVPRVKEVMLMGYDAISKKNITLHLTNYAAAVVQHEYDHLEGKLLHDYVGE